MIIYVAWPSRNLEKSNATAREWFNHGYQVAVASELPEAWAKPVAKDIVADRVFHFTQYDGYYRTMNAMCQWLVKECKADVVVCAGDGILPHKEYPAWAIGGMFAQHFPNGMGIMQPVGQKWVADDKPRQYNFHDWPDVTRRCESPWIGGPLIRKIYGGQGPYCKDYGQYWGDVELFDVAQKMGVLWRNDGLVQQSEHWSQAGGKAGLEYQTSNYDRCYESDYAQYRARRFKDFPGHNAHESRIITPSSNGRIIIP